MANGGADPPSGLRSRWARVTLVGLVLVVAGGLGTLVWWLVTRDTRSAAEQEGYHLVPDDLSAPFTRARWLGASWNAVAGAPVTLYYDGTHTGPVQWQFSRDGFNEDAVVVVAETLDRSYPWRWPTDVPVDAVCQLRVLAVPERAGPEWRVDSPVVQLRPYATLDRLAGLGAEAGQAVAVGTTVAVRVHTNTPHVWTTGHFEVAACEVEEATAGATFAPLNASAIALVYDDEAHKVAWAMPATWVGTRVLFQVRVYNATATTASRTLLWSWQLSHAVQLVADAKRTVVSTATSSSRVASAVWVHVETGVAPVRYAHPGESMRCDVHLPGRTAGDRVELHVVRSDEDGTVLLRTALPDGQNAVTWTWPDVPAFARAVPIHTWVTVNLPATAVPGADGTDSTLLPALVLQSRWQTLGPMPTVASDAVMASAAAAAAAVVGVANAARSGRNAHVVPVPLALCGWTPAAAQRRLQWGMRVKRREVDAWSFPVAFTPAAVTWETLPTGMDAYQANVTLQEYWLPPDGGTLWQTPSLWLQLALREDAADPWQWVPYRYELLQDFARDGGTQAANLVSDRAQVQLLTGGAALPWPSVVNGYGPLTLMFTHRQKVTNAVQWEWTYDTWQADQPEQQPGGQPWAPLSAPMQTPTWTWQPRAPVAADVAYWLRVVDVTVSPPVPLAVSGRFRIQWDAPDEEANAPLELLGRFANRLTAATREARTADLTAPRAEVASPGAVCTTWTGPVDTGTPLVGSGLRLWCRPYVDAPVGDDAVASSRTWRPLPATVTVVRCGRRRLDWTVPVDWPVGSTYEVAPANRTYPLAQSYGRQRVTVRGAPPATTGVGAVMRAGSRAGPVAAAERGVDPVGSWYWLPGTATPPQVRSRWTFGGVLGEWTEWGAPARTALRLGTQRWYGWPVPAPFASATELTTRDPASTAPGDVWTWAVEARASAAAAWGPLTEGATDGVGYRVYVRRSPTGWWHTGDGILRSDGALALDLWGWAPSDVKVAYQWEPLPAAESVAGSNDAPVSVVEGGTWAAETATHEGPVRLPVYHALDVAKKAAALAQTPLQLRLVVQMPDGWEAATPYAPVRT